MAPAPALAAKSCSKCGETKPLADFHLDATKPDGRAPRCRGCKNAANAESYRRWTPEQRELHRHRVIRHRYGVEADLIRSMFEQQEGCCAICGVPGEMPFTAEKNRSLSRVLCIDHDHGSGAVRGLLCHVCNTGLGKLGDSVERLVKAAGYLVERGGQ